MLTEDEKLAYDSGQILCRKCLFEEIEESGLREYLDNYAATLPKETRAPEAEYIRRLSLCEGCGHRIRFTCTLCGCYIQARAAKKHQKCPIPGTPKWSAITEEEGE
jgi:hypothetical protein